LIKKILISDSQPISANGFLNLINRVSFPVECVTTDAQLDNIHNYLNVYTPEMLILDISTLKNSMEILKQIKFNNKFVKILVLNSCYNKSLAINSIKIGAMGYVSKTDPLDELERAVERILGGGIYLGKQLNEELSDS